MGHENMSDDPEELGRIKKLLDRKIAELEARIDALYAEREKVRLKIEKLI